MRLPYYLLATICYLTVLSNLTAQSSAIDSLDNELERLAAAGHLRSSLPFAEGN